MPPRVSTTPKAVAQKRKTTLAADTIAGRSVGRVTVRKTWRRAGAERGRGLTGAAVERLPGGADGADHHGHVEEHQAGHDRDGRAVEVQEAQRAVVAQQLPERDADHHGRQHERHQQQAANQRAEREGQPVQGVRRREAEQQADRRRRAGGPDGEPQHPVHPRPGQHLRHGPRVERARRARTRGRSCRPPAARRRRRAPRPAAAPVRSGESHRRFIGGPSPGGDVAPLAQPVIAVGGHLGGVDGVGVGGPLGQLRPLGRQLGSRRPPGRRTCCPAVRPAPRG